MTTGREGEKDDREGGRGRRTTDREGTRLSERVRRMAGREGKGRQGERGRRQQP